MYAFFSSTVNRLQSVQTDSVTCSFKWFFISKKPELQLMVSFFAVCFSSVAVFFWLCELDFKTLDKK